jgi:hypothetical protein
MEQNKAMQAERKWRSEFFLKSRSLAPFPPADRRRSPLQKNFTTETLLETSMDGRLTNRTGETLLVYGPKRPGEPKDNSLYYLPTGRMTPDDWDCDGFYVPNDRVADQALTDKNGPLAIKYRDYRSPEITMTVATHYKCHLNEGAYAPGELNWEIPNIPISSIPGAYPEVPGHNPAT